MKLIGINDYDISSYKEPAMFLSFPRCSFKCGAEWCQNYHLKESDLIDIDYTTILATYQNSPFSHAIVCGGLEPFDSWDELECLVSNLRLVTPDPIVIYTGYTEAEVLYKVNLLSVYENIIVKYGRYIPGNTPHYDEILGVELASDNQYAKIYNPIDARSIK